MTGSGRLRADAITAGLPRTAWQRLSAGKGTKGQRWYDWALIDIIDNADRAGSRWLLIRRNPATGELASYRCFSPNPVPLHTLVTVAGRRWTIEESFASGKGLCGLDEHQVRTWTSWRRWVILSMLAFAFLAVQAASERSSPLPPPGLIPLTCNEIAHLLNAQARRPTRDLSHCLRWSTWRRRHQHRARLCHYRARGDNEDHDLRL